MFKSIKIKFLITQLGFVLAMTVVLGLATYFIMFRSLRDNQLQYLEYVSVTTGEKINLLSLKWYLVKKGGRFSRSLVHDMSIAKST